MPQSQLQMATPGVSQLGQVANQIALGLARQNAMKEYQRQQILLKQAQFAQEVQQAQQQEALRKAQTGLAEARTGAVTNAEQAKAQMGDAAWLMGMVNAGQRQGIDMGPRQDIAISRMMDAMGRLPDAARARFPENIAQMLQMPNPRAQEMLATGTKMTANVPAGGTLVDILNQKVLERSPRTLAPGNVLVPGQGGEPIATAPNRPVGSNLGQLFGPLVNLRGQGMVSGVPVQQQNPTYQASDEAIRALISLLMRGTTNAPGLSLPPAQRSTELDSTLPTIQTREDFDALPKGTKYIGKDGKTYMKP